MIKNSMFKKLFLILLLVFIIFPNINAETISQFCTGSTGLINPKNTIFTLAPNAPNAMLEMTILIISVMIAIVGLLYAIAYAFGIEKLLIFTRAEIGEMVLTGAVVFIFLMFFNVFSSSASGPNSIVNIYGYDCTTMVSASLGLIAPLIQLSITNLILHTISHVTVTLEPVFMGFSVSPFAGFEIIANPLNIAIGISGLVIMLMLGMSVVLGIIYSFFPIFLYLGIVLRALPWTRAAGGAFLGLFAGLFIMFPLMLYFGLMGPTAFACSSSSTASSAATPSSSSTTTSASSSSTSSSCYSSSTAVNNINNDFKPGAISSITAALSNMVTIISGGILIPPFKFLVKEIIEPVLYTLIIYIFSLLIAFDFMEEVGDLLGAPSLSSEHALKKVI